MAIQRAGPCHHLNERGPSRPFERTVRCPARLRPLQPIWSKQLDRVQRADCAVPACQVIRGAVLRASPADAFRIPRQQWCASHQGPTCSSVRPGGPGPYDARHRRRPQTAEYSSGRATTPFLEDRDEEISAAGTAPRARGCRDHRGVRPAIGRRRAGPATRDRPVARAESRRRGPRDQDVRAARRPRRVHAVRVGRAFRPGARHRRPVDAAAEDDRRLHAGAVAGLRLRRGLVGEVAGRRRQRQRPRAARRATATATATGTATGTGTPRRSRCAGATRTTRR